MALGLFGSKTKTVISSKVVGGKQGPLLIVQRNTLAPMPSPVTAVFALPALAKVPLPLTTLHCPVAGAIGRLAFNVTPAPGAQAC